ncbi:hypothetical protein, partial [Streptococcus pneumoniae]|uniref:hypothetical protein n=1 Tax=Streptococcus pneumoniae TaxID=1313 RepID=UPI0018B0A985
GKEVAKRLLEGKPMETYKAGKTYRVKAVSGVDLKVGGEGMKAFYDKIVPAVAKDVLRKVGGGRLINVELQQPGLRAGMRDPETGATLGPDFEQQAGKNLDQPGFDITPEMQEKA